MMGEKKYMFAKLGWENEIRNIGYHHIFCNPSSECDIGIAN